MWAFQHLNTIKPLEDIPKGPLSVQNPFALSLCIPMSNEIAETNICFNKQGDTHTEDVADKKMVGPHQASANRTLLFQEPFTKVWDDLRTRLDYFLQSGQKQCKGQYPQSAREIDIQKQDSPEPGQHSSWWALGLQLCDPWSLKLPASPIALLFTSPKCCTGNAGNPLFKRYFITFLCAYS